MRLHISERSGASPQPFTKRLDVKSIYNCRQRILGGIRSNIHTHTRHLTPSSTITGKQGRATIAFLRAKPLTVKTNTKGRQISLQTISLAAQGESMP